MERKSIGSFIAVLRKAGGMTQRELADKLGISDKAVSRWERDETAPDLYLIPVIADIFGVTSDELLRGERVSMGERIIENTEQNEKQKEKSEKQVKAVLKAARNKFLTKTLICALIASVGMLGALLCNFVFFRCTLGFFVGLIFFTAAVIIEIAFAISAFSALDTEEFDLSAVRETKKYIIKKTELIVFLCVIFFAYCIPFLLAGVDTSFVNVRADFDSWFIVGTFFAVIFAIIGYVVNLRIDKNAERKGIYTVEETVRRKRALAKFRFISPLPKLGKIFLPMLAVTIALHIVCLNVFSYEFFLRRSGTAWSDANSFVAYMQTPLDREGKPYDYSHTTFQTHRVWFEGTQISFLYRNRYVSEYMVGDTTSGDSSSGNGGYIIIEFLPDDGSGNVTRPSDETYDIKNFSAGTFTESEALRARDCAYYVSSSFVVAYIAEAAALIIIYAVKVKYKFKEELE